jgi:tetratricopeptide (TPR) repeat protein/mono/diheme cytochrome c family protein
MKAGLLAAIVFTASAAVLPAAAAGAPQESPAPAPTFSKDIAPLLFDRCAQCHQPGGSGPFSVLTYDEVRRHAGQIAEVTASRYMPPWKAEPGYGGPFVGQHPLSDAEIALIRRWVDTGAEEGDPARLPKPPAPTQGWQLGKPDVVVTLPEPYHLQADGTDVFRVFVIPVPVNGLKFVRGLEFHPENPRVVHHANIRVDPTPASRKMDEADPEPGYRDIILRSAQYPDGHFLGWTPGQVAPLLPKGLAWRLSPGTDLVVEIHMQPDGKPELVQPQIGLYFGTDPPDRVPVMLRLGDQRIDIPAGDPDYTITDSYTLPVDAEIEAVQPHAHYRAREIRGQLTLPDGTTQWLIYIKDWDFKWQHVYRLVHPYWVPKGTTLSMRYVYDNSSNNPHNPQQPPQHVHWGQRSRDEMGDLWIQVLTRTDRDRDALIASFRPKVLTEDAYGYESMIRAEPDVPELHDDVALIYLELGQLDKGIAHFEASEKMRPDSAQVHFNLATALTMAGRLDESIAEYRKAIALQPDLATAHNNLGNVLFSLGHRDEALKELGEAVRLDPGNAQAHLSMGLALRSQGDIAGAISHYREAVALKPDWPPALANLAWLLAAAPDAARRSPAEAVRLAERAVDLTGRRDGEALDVLATAYAADDDFDRALQTEDAALALVSDGPAATAMRQRRALYGRHQTFVLAP